MKVCYIFREKERKAHSIEILFDLIASEVRNEGIEVEKWYKPLSNIKAIFEVRKLQADVYHITGDCYFLALFLPWSKTIMTVHDIGMYKNHSRTLKRILFVWLSFILPMKVLKYCTAISELTKNDLVDLLGVEPNKIKIVPNPLVLSIKPVQRQFNTNNPTILQIGTGTHKNLEGLLKAIASINCHLDIVGTPSKNLVTEMELKNISYSISSNLTSQEIEKKYQNSDIVFFASLSEGFGLPILEAQSARRAIVTSNIEPMKTVAGEGAVLVDPTDHLSIKFGIQKIIAEDDYRENCIKKGLLNINRFRKEKIIAEYLAVYALLE